MRRSSGTGYNIGLFLMEEKLRNWLYYWVISYGGEAQELVILLGYFLWRRSSGTGYLIWSVLIEEKSGTDYTMGLLLTEEKLKNWLLNWVSFN
jgi:hypothetical protein